ncbi:hypothetical protein [Parvularcula oceani]|uniref:hypothetical protein n=1 Tax=Parvularcula oceani TaxID=1247963 RepID=UPI0004E0E80C|nr:hypothetical protein [Parvularcula oceani]
MRTMMLAMVAFVFAACSVDGRQPGPVEAVVGEGACLTWFTERGAEAAGRPGALRRLSSDHACFDGTFASGEEGAEGTAALAAWATEVRTDDRKLLVLRSHGGDANRALAIAEALQAQDATVLASEICASSCANYLYAGLPDRHVTDGTLILFHGGFSDQTRTRVAAELDALYAQHGELFDDVEADRARVLGDYDDARTRQDALLTRAEASLAVIHGVDAMDKEALPASRCGGDSTLPRDFLYFGARQAEALGIAPLTGTPLTDPEAVNAAIAARTDMADRFVACHAPGAIG